MKLVILIPLVLSYSISCLIEYVSYKINCPISRYECPNANCAESLDIFKCCLKSTHSEASTVLNITRWDSMDLDPRLLGIKKSLIVRKEKCEINNVYYESGFCKEIPDEKSNTVNLVVEDQGTMLIEKSVYKKQLNAFRTLLFSPNTHLRQQ